jgi:hypothetical protein
MVLFWHTVDKVVSLTANPLLNFCNGEFAHRHYPVKGTRLAEAYFLLPFNEFNNWPMRFSIFHNSAF